MKVLQPFAIKITHKYIYISKLLPQFYYYTTHLSKRPFNFKSKLIECHKILTNPPLIVFPHKHKVHIDPMKTWFLL
jgi:hypothetical protein